MKTLVNSQTDYRTKQITRQALPFLLLAATFSCTQPNQMHGQRIRVGIGQIKEVSLPTPGDNPLTGTSDNSEVVAVSPKSATTETSATTSDKSTFLIKGVTAGTARVVFTKKQPGTSGTDRVVKTYVVQVTTK